MRLGDGASGEDASVPRGTTLYTSAAYAHFRHRAGTPEVDAVPRCRAALQVKCRPAWGSFQSFLPVCGEQRAQFGLLTAFLGFPPWAVECVTASVQFFASWCSGSVVRHHHDSVWEWSLALVSSRPWHRRPPPCFCVSWPRAWAWLPRSTVSEVPPSCIGYHGSCLLPGTFRCMGGPRRVSTSGLTPLWAAVSSCMCVCVDLCFHFSWKDS